MREMKDSGIAWVGKIPAHWTKKKGKYILRYMSKPVKQDDSVITCFRDGEVTLRSNRREDGFTMADKEIGYQGVDVGDLVVHGMDGFAGAIGISDSRGKASPVLNVLNTKQNKKYIMYYLRSMAYGEVFTALSTGIRVRSCDLRWNKLAELLYPLPPIDEQNNIVNYIDEQIARTNEIIADTQAQIDTLEQYKRSIITEAVTHGLNPSAPMKDSGVPWVGNIPKHWNCCSLKYNYNTISGATPNSNDISLWDGEIVWVTPADYKTKDVYVCSGARKITYKGYLSCSTTLIKQGNIIFSKRAPIGSVAINKVELCTSQGCLSVVSKTGNVNNKYFYYLFSVNDETFNLFGSGTTFQEISAKDFLNVKFPLPSLDEQQEIADYLDNKCAEIEQIIADKKSQIETLDGYKKALIYECVTGKKEIV